MSPKTLTDVLVRLERDPTLPLNRRRVLSGAIRTICAIVGRPPEAVTADLSAIERLLGAIPRAVHGRSSKTVANARSALRTALLHCAGAPKLPPRGMALRPAWASLRERLVDLRLEYGLARLMRIASFHEITPEEMSDEVMQRIVDIVRSGNWGRDALPFQRTTIQLWNEAAATVPGWPSVHLTLPPKATRPKHLPLTAFPQTFQQDLDAYLGWAAGNDPLAADAPAKRLEESTLELRRNHLRMAASTLAKHLGDPARVTQLADLVQPEHAKQILTAFLPTDAHEAPGAFVRGMAMTLATMAWQWVKVDPTHLAELRRLQQRLGKPPTGLTPKNRAAIRQLEDPRVLGALLALPDTLRKQAASGRLSPSRRLQKVQIALAIDILLVAPLRLQNLATLQLNRQVVWPSGRDGTVYLWLAGHETKNDQPLEYLLPNRTRDALHDYLDRYRRRDKGEASSWLFARLDGTPVPLGTLRDGIIKAIQREVGVRVTPHQFRHLAAKIMLDAQPGALGMVKDLLGHKSLRTTQNFYAGFRTRQAGRVFDQIMSGMRTAAMGAR